MKKITKALIAIIVLILIVSPITAMAHSGRTDANGGHKDNKNKSGLGSYHYHCGGHPPHLHGSGGCPYGSSSNTKPTSSSNKKSTSGSSSSSSQTSSRSVPATVYASSVKVIEAPKSLNLGEEANVKCSVYPENAVNKEIT